MTKLEILKSIEDIELVIENIRLRLLILKREILETKIVPMIAVDGQATKDFFSKKRQDPMSVLEEVAMAERGEI